MNKKNWITLVIFLVVVITTAIIAATTRHNSVDCQKGSEAGIVNQPTQSMDSDCRKKCNKRNNAGVPPCRKRRMQQAEGTRSVL